ncbi:hypothetical protein ACHAPO_005066 [Fusarium lateritium]
MTASSNLPGVNGDTNIRSNDHGRQSDVWKHAPVLIGTTKFEPRPDVKNIMITGGAGFIESHNFTFYNGDITNPAEVVDCMERYDIDTVLHFAAQSHVDLSFGNSYGFTHTNVYGTHVLLESAKKVGIGRFIHVSTDEVYGEVKEDDDDLLETSILAPTNPYAASKAAAEMLRPLVLHGDGLPTRRYLYAGDAADAFDTILHKGQIGQIYNVGSHDEVSNLELSSMLLDRMEISHDTPEQLRKWIKYTRDRPFNDRRYAVDGTKLKRLGWEQKVSIDEGLKITVDWFTRFGESWWGDISHVLTPFPTVSDGEMVPDDARSMRDEPHDSQDIQQGKLPEQQKKEDANGCRDTRNGGGMNGVYQTGERHIAV